MNSAVLPDGKVLALGGTTGAGFNNESHAVLSSRALEPATGTWTTLASMQIPRLYHSSAVLLPDARVLARRAAAAAARAPSTTSTPRSSRHRTCSRPTARRPCVRTIDTALGDGELRANASRCNTPEPPRSRGVTWVRLPATTHSFNQNQWINELASPRGSSAAHA